MDHMGPGKATADLPVAARTVEHLQAALDALRDDEMAERIAGYGQMLAELPADDDTMRPTIEALRDVLAVELRARQHGRRRMA